MILLAEADEEGGDYGTGVARGEPLGQDRRGRLAQRGRLDLQGRRRRRRELIGVTTIDKNSLSVTLAHARDLDALLAAAARRARSAGSRARCGRDRALRDGDVKLNPAARALPADLGGRRSAAHTGQATSASCSPQPEAQRSGAGAGRLESSRYGELFDGLAPRNIFVPTIVESGFRAQRATRAPPRPR